MSLTFLVGDAWTWWFWNFHLRASRWKFHFCPWTRRLFCRLKSDQRLDLLCRLGQSSAFAPFCTRVRDSCGLDLASLWDFSRMSLATEGFGRSELGSCRGPKASSLLKELPLAVKESECYKLLLDLSITAWAIDRKKWQNTYWSQSELEQRICSRRQMRQKRRCIPVHTLSFRPPRFHL